MWYRAHNQKKICKQIGTEKFDRNDVREGYRMIKKEDVAKKAVAKKDRK